jgi:hypothetical protein
MNAASRKCIGDAEYKATAAMALASAVSPTACCWQHAEHAGSLNCMKLHNGHRLQP